MDLLTTEEYKSIAEQLNLPSDAFIDGVFRPAASGNTFISQNPASGKILTEVAACGQRDVDFAVIKAREAFDDGRWSMLSPGERKDILIRLCKLLARNAQELAVMESIDSGKTIYDCETFDIPETIQALKWHAEAIDKIYDQIAPASNEHIAMIVREPLGVVGLVLPWNFPLMMMAWKIGPALAAGCSVIVKPAAETPLTALRLAELGVEAGIPRGVLNVIPGSGLDTGEPIGRHPDIDMVAFTGTTVTGKRFLSYSGESNCKEIVLEMGGKNPCIVMDDAENLDHAAQHVVTGAFWNMGENCTAISRLIVHKNIKEELVERIKMHANQWPLGDPLDPQTRIGAIVSQSHFEKIRKYLDRAEQIVFGGNTFNGTHIEPTLVEVNDTNDILARDEILGPLLSMITVASFDEAIEVANDTKYGLSAAIFTANGKRAIRGARALRAGTVTLNCFGEGDATTPFGGYKQSGFGGRDKALQAHDQYTQVKTIWVDLSDDEDDAVG